MTDYYPNLSLNFLPKRFIKYTSQNKIFSGRQRMGLGKEGGKIILLKIFSI
jgi:hypothetical protein